jgi:xylan 1,4-beta-xylosidase
MSTNHHCVANAATFSYFSRMRHPIKSVQIVTVSLLTIITWSSEMKIVRASENAPPPVRVIAADWQNVKGPHSDMFHECIGAGRAAEGLRAEWQRQLKMCQDDVGFKYIRFHGLLCDDMGVYGETPDGKPRRNWQYVDQLYDALLAMRIRPFVEISFMPSALASGNKTIFWWRANVTPPKSYDRWDDLIKDLVQHWTDRYGADEVKHWYFEVWNEADYPAFFGPRDPNRRREEYFELYAHTAADVKSVNPVYRIGGPAGSTTGWVLPLIEFGQSNNVPLDFISFHSYGLGGGPSGLDEYGEQLHYLSSDLRAPAETAVRERRPIDASPRPGLPIHITEWSTSYSPRDPVHDAYFSAPYILEQFKHSEQGIASMSYWVFTDIFEEAGPPMTPFHGGFGLLTVQGIKKPAYFAYHFMNQLGPTELKNDDAASWVCRDKQGGAQILLWDLTRPADPTVPNQAIFRKLNPAQSKGNVRVSLTNVPRGKYRLTLWQVGFEKNDAYSAYLKMGSPAQLSRAQEQQLRDAASGKPEFKRRVKIGADGRFDKTLPLRENDVLVLTLAPE